MLVVVRAILWLSLVAALMPRVEPALPPVPREARAMVHLLSAFEAAVIFRLAAVKADIAADQARREHLHKPD